MREFMAAAYLFLPLLVGLVIHGLIIKFDLFKFLTNPLDQNKTFRGKRIFGANKTYRGFLGVTLGTVIGFAIQSILLHRFPAIQALELLDYTLPKALMIGLLVGVAAMLSELPNSFIKRQLGVAPGRAAQSYLNIVFYIFDQIDFLVGVWLILALFLTVTVKIVLASVVIIFICHQILSVGGYFLGMRATMR